MDEKTRDDSLDQRLEFLESQIGFQDRTIEAQIRAYEEHHGMGPFVHLPAQPAGELHRAPRLPTSIQGHRPGRIGNGRQQRLPLGAETLPPFGAAPYSDGHLAELHPSLRALAVAFAQTVPLITPMAARPEDYQLARSGLHGTALYFQRSAVWSGIAC